MLSIAATPDTIRGDLLPRTRMAAAITEADRYRVADPFPHAVLDDFFAEEVLDAVADEFPGPGDIAWRHQHESRQSKLSNFDEDTMGPTTRRLVHSLNSAPFLRWLSALTGIENLIPDPYLEGGGMHLILPGGKLGVHADFNRHKTLGLERRVNVLVYLNKDWSESYGGHLELWDEEMSECRQRVLPVFNRVAIFSTTSSTFHGHPDPLTCPEGRGRQSLAFYYYTNDSAPEQIRTGHSTLFQARPGEQFAPVRRPLIQRLTPPILVEWVRRLRGQSV